MDAEWSRSAAVLCRSRWEPDAEEHGVWSRNDVRESRAREDSRTPGRCRAHPRSRPGNEADPRDGWKAPKLMDAEWSRSAAVLCRSRWEPDAEEHGVWSRNEVRESRAREDSRTPRRCRAHPRSRRGNEADPRRMESPQVDGLRTVLECGSPLPLCLETGCEKNAASGTALQDAVARICVAAEGTRRIPDGWKAPKLMDSERSRSAAVLCRSCWKRGAKEHDVWSRTGFASRERERTRALQDAAARI